MLKQAALVLTCLTGVSLADPPPCARWDNGLSCTDVGSNCATDAKLRYWYSKLYSDTPLDACKKFFATYANPPTTVTAVATANADTFSCYIDGGTSPAHSVYLVPIQLEPMCFRKPNVHAPYYKLGTTGTYGGDFSTSRKRTITNENWDANGNTYQSDYSGDYFTQLVSGSLNVDSSVNVDHIIPRVDIKGCPCGPNSPANALVISRKLNIEMSNYPNNTDRQTILNMFTTW